MEVQIKALAKSINDKDKTIDVVMSVEVIDRHSEIVDIETLNFENFLLNPVLLQSHDYDKMPVGKVVSLIKTINGIGLKQLEGKVQFAVDQYDVAKTHYEMYRDGFMFAFSIGMKVGEFVFDQELGITILKNCELLEVSCVSVPANQLALAKTKGINILPIIKMIPKEKLNTETKILLNAIKDLLSDIEVPINKEVEDKSFKRKRLLQAIIKTL